MLLQLLTGPLIIGLIIRTKIEASMLTYASLLIDPERLSAPFADDGGEPWAMDPETTSIRRKNGSILGGHLKIQRGLLDKKSNFLARD